MGAEAAALDARQSLERLFHEFQEQPLAFVGGGGARKTRARAAVGVGRQGELRDRQQLPADVAQRQVHLARRIRKDAVAEHAFREAPGLGFAVAALDADQRQHAGADRARCLAADGDARLGDALDERDHAMMSGISRVRSLAIWSLRNSLRFFSRRSCSWSWAGSPARRSITSSRSWCSISRA